MSDIALLDSIYHNLGSQGAYASVENVFKRCQKLYPQKNISRKAVASYLELQTPYSLHRKRYKILKRNATYSPRVNYNWAMDLMDVSNLKQYNDDFNFILVVIDTLSRFLYTEKLKNKSAASVTAAFKSIFERAQKLPSLINSDKGTEFTNKTLQKLFKKHSIRHFISYGEHKASQAERVIRTLKELFYRYFDHTLQRKWHDKLQDFTHTYNTSFNRAIKMTPEEASTYPNDLYLSEKALKMGACRKKQPATLKKGDYVRVNLSLGVFAKSYEALWSRALYKIIKGPYYTTAGAIPLYHIAEAWSGEKFEGGFLPHELLKVDTETYVTKYNFPIHKVIKRGPKTSLVRWLGYDERYNSRVPNNRIKNLAAF